MRYIFCNPENYRDYKERKVIVIYYLLKYVIWPEEQREKSKLIDESSVSQDELFIRKLVDATLLSDQLYIHLSHESDDQAGELIYITPFNSEDLETYGNAVESTINTNSVVSSRVEYLLWNGASFQAPQQLFPLPTFKRDIAAYLLNHYLVFSNITYEVLFSIYDKAKDRVLLFLKEAESDEQ